MDRVTIASQSRGSWERFTTATPTDRFVGACKTCVRPMAQELADHAPDRLTVTCLECGQYVSLQRIYGTQTTDSCDGSCMSAMGPICQCGCGGKNHGKWFTNYTWPGEEVNADYIAALAKYRATVARNRETARVKRERKEADRQAQLTAACAAFRAENADVMEAMFTERENDSILDDMLSRFEREGALSPRSLNYAESIITNMRAQREREAQQVAKRAARLSRGVEPRYVGTVDAKVTVSGIVTVTYQIDSAYGPKMMIIVEGTGSDEGVTAKWTGTAKAIWSLNRGDVVTMTGTVVKHADYQGTPQTVMTRCKVTVSESQNDVQPVAEYMHATQVWSDGIGHGSACGLHTVSAAQSTQEPSEVTCPQCLKSLPASETSAEPNVTTSGKRVPKGATANSSRFPRVWLREGETIQAAFLPGQHGPRHCGYGDCGKEVVQIFARLSSGHHYDPWRHADGSGGHDALIASYDCEPVWQCSQCGSENKKHCPKCHTDDARVYTQEAWGDRHTCTACDRNDFYSIGD